MSDCRTAIVDAIGMLAELDADEQAYALARLSDPQLRALQESWPAWAHEGQMPPKGDWRVWLISAGRGFGKTRAGAETISELARVGGEGLRIALVGATAAEAERVMIRGESGLMAVARTGEALLWYPTRGRLEFSSGAVAFVYSGANPESLRGPEHHYAWCDELAKWAYPQQTWDNLMLGLRLGVNPRTIVTTTPRPSALLRRLLAGADTAVSRGRTADNLNLPDAFVTAVRDLYAGTRLGRQELDGELIEDVEGALWTRALVERCRGRIGGSRFSPGAGGDSRFSPGAGGDSHFSRGGASSEPTARESDCPLGAGSERAARESDGPLRRVVVGVDPPASAGGDACGIVVCGIDGEGVGWVLDDRSVSGLSPEGWAAAVVRAAEAWSADRVVVENNQGGDMVESVLRSADCGLPVAPVRARFGKGKRAEPVAMKFERGLARFAGAFPELEDELCGLTAGGGYEGPGRSPDRADAMVWAMTELLCAPEQAEPRVRTL